MTPLPEPKPALLLAAHGTRDQAGVDAFAALAERVGKLAAADGTRVAGGFIELSAPALREAVAELAAATPGPMVAIPLMLSAAGHAKGDIPAALARERARHPAVRFTYARPLGPHPALIDLLAARIAAVAGDTPPAVLLVGRGSTDPDANADVVKTARLLWEGRDYPLAETAFVSLARPGVAEGLERCRLLGAGLPGAGLPGTRPARYWPARAAADRGGQVLPVPRGAAGPGGRTGRRVCRRASRARHQVRRRARRLRRDRRPGLRAVPRGAGRGHPDELRHVRVPDRDAGVRGPRRRAAASP